MIQNAKLALTQCWKCLGCNRLENINFQGDNECKSFKDYQLSQNVEQQEITGFNFFGKKAADELK